MRLTLLVVCVLAFLSVSAQTPVESKKPSLQERYSWMKTSSQTFKEYKVIKEVDLDKEWKVIMDSIKADRLHWAETKAQAARLEVELLAVKNTLKEKEESVAETEYAATHIDFMGKDFSKPVFVGIAVAIVAGLLLLLGLLVGRLKILFSDLKDRTEALNALHLELEEYKRKALEKQTKLSRELQNERNRLQDLRA